MDITDHRVCDSDDLYLVYQFISSPEAESLLNTITSAQQKWKQVDGRGVREYGGAITKRGHIACKLPSWLEGLCDKVHKSLQPDFFKNAPQHVLINAYQPGDGIMPHEDGPKYESVVAILSLGAPTVFRFYEKPSALSSDSGGAPNKPAVSLLLPSKSLLVFKGKYYDQYLHGINAVEQELVDCTVVNRHLFPRQADAAAGNNDGVPGAGNGSENDSLQGQHGAEDAWSFPRGGTRVSLTMRNGLHKIASVQL